MAKTDRTSTVHDRRSQAGSNRSGRDAGQHRATAAETRESILQAARQRFLHYGFKKTTIDDIAGAAGVGKGTVYLYFEGKDEIMLTLVLDVKRRISEQMEAIAAGDDPEERKLERMILSSILTVHEACTTSPHGNELVDDFRDQMNHCPRLNEGFVAEHDAQLRLLASIIARGQAAGRIAEGDPARAAELLTLAFNAFYPPYHSPVRPTWRSREHLEEGARELFAFILKGLRRTPPECPGEGSSHP